MNNIKYLVVHCSDTPDVRNHNAADIHQWHLERDWSGIGYHAVIDRFGNVEMGRPTYWQGAHVKGHNHHSLGVCLIGQEVYTPIQYQALMTLLSQWQSQHPEAVIVGHNDLTPHKTCPNFNVQQWAAENGLQHLEKDHETID